MEITWHGCASISLTADGVTLLFDPFVPLTGSLGQPTLGDFLPASHILITHGHLDHIASVPELLSSGGGVAFATASPCSALLQQGVAHGQLKAIQPGDILRFEGGVTVRILRGRHVSFDVPLVIGTLLSPRLLRRPADTWTLLRLNHRFREAQETVIFEVEATGLHITLLGSLGLSDGETYRLGPDLLVIPYQGSSRLVDAALAVVERLFPQAVLLDHFDDAFPPISRQIDTQPFVEAMSRWHPDAKVLVPERGQRQGL